MTKECPFVRMLSEIVIVTIKEWQPICQDAGFQEAKMKLN